MSRPIRVLVVSPIPEEGAGCRFRIAHYIPYLESHGFEVTLKTLFTTDFFRLVYKPGQPGAPRVIAKGQDRIALRIREIARKNHVPVLENPPLARALFAQAELGDEIPADLYRAVAEVLALLWRMGSVPLSPQPLTTTAFPTEPASPDSQTSTETESETN